MGKLLYRAYVSVCGGGHFFVLRFLFCHLAITPYFRIFWEKSTPSPVNYLPPCLPILGGRINKATKLEI